MNHFVVNFTRTFLIWAVRFTIKKDFGSLLPIVIIFYFFMFWEFWTIMSKIIENNFLNNSKPIFLWISLKISITDYESLLFLIKANINEKDTKCDVNNTFLPFFLQQNLFKLLMYLDFPVCILNSWNTFLHLNILYQLYKLFFAFFYD